MHFLRFSLGNCRILWRFSPRICELSGRRFQRDFTTTLECRGFDKYSLKRNKNEFRKQTKTVERVFKRTPSVSVFELDPLSKENAPVEQTSTRQDSLSSVVFDAVNGMFMSQDVDEELSQLIEITEVQMTKGLRTAIVYWKSPEGMENTVENLLSQSMDKLRRIFPTYHQMTRSPNLQFKKDKNLEYISKVNELLEKADFGPDYVPTGSTIMFPHDIKKLEKEIFIDNEIKTTDEEELLQEHKDNSPNNNRDDY